MEFDYSDRVLKPGYTSCMGCGEALRPARVIVDILVVSDRVFREWADTPNTVIYEAAKEGKVYEQVI